MARNPFPTGDFGRRVSEGPIGGDIGAPAAGTATALGAAVKGLGAEIGKMADRAYKREGEADAARAIRAADDFGQTPALRQGTGVAAEAYNGLMRDHLLTRRVAAFEDDLSRAEMAHPENEAGFAEAVSVARQAYRDQPIGDPVLDTQFEQQAVLRSQVALRRVRVGQEKGRVDRARGAFADSLSQSQTGLAQVVSGAGFDDEGIQLVQMGTRTYLERVARYGPKEGFVLGGVEFGPDASRLDVMGAEELSRQVQADTVRARSAWMVSAVEQAPDAASAAAMAGQMHEQFVAGNPVFAGLDAQDMAQIGGRIEAVVSRKGSNEGAQRTQAGALARDLMTAAEYGGEYDIDQMRQLAAQSGDPGLVAQVEFAAKHGFGTTPANLKANTPVGGGFDGWVNFLLDDLEGPGLVGDDNGAGRAQWGITERSHPEAWADGKVTREEAVAIYQQYWNDIGGASLPPALAQAAASAAVVAGVGAAKRWLAAAGGDVEKFHDLQLAHFERLARENPAKYGGSLNGWKKRDALSRQRSRQVAASERSAEGFASDPIDFARGNKNRDAMVDVPEFDPNRLFGDHAEAGQFIAARLAVGRELNTRAGVPVAVFDKAELATIKDHIEADPSKLVGLIQTAALTPGVGSEGVRVVLSQLGMAGTASADLHLGWLASTPSTRNVAAKVVQGRALRADGAQDVKWPADELDIGGMAQRVAPAFALQPELFPVVQATARDMAIADAARGQLQSAEAYVNSALGAVTHGGHTYGGVSRVNGADTLAPMWLRRDYLDEAVEVAAQGWVAQDRGPLYSNGQPIPVRVLTRYQLRAAPNGRYRLINSEGQTLAARNGQAFEFDPDSKAFRDVMRRRYPGSVLPSVRD